MQIKNARVNWMYGWGNDPFLEIQVEDLPKHEDLKYVQHGPLYFAERDGYVHYLADSNNHNGYGGAHFTLNLANGEKVTLIGPWSSRSSAANALGCTPSVEVVAFKTAADFNSHHGGISICITEPLYLKAIEDFVEGVEAVTRYEGREFRLRLKAKGIFDPCGTCKGSKVAPIERGSKILKPCTKCMGTGEKHV